MPGQGGMLSRSTLKFFPCNYHDQVQDADDDDQNDAGGFDYFQLNHLIPVYFCPFLWPFLITSAMGNSCGMCGGTGGGHSCQYGMCDGQGGNPI